MHHAEMTDWRWASFTNQSGEIAPAYALLRVSRGATNEYDAYKPNKDSQTGLLINGDVDIAVAGGGNVRELYLPTQILYNPADGTPSAGQEWGSAPDDWRLRRNRLQKGFLTLGAGDGSKVWAMAVPFCCETAPGGGGTPTACGDECTTCTPSMVATVRNNRTGEEIKIELVLGGARGECLGFDPTNLGTCAWCGSATFSDGSVVSVAAGGGSKNDQCFVNYLIDWQNLSGEMYGLTCVNAAPFGCGTTCLDFSRCDFVPPGYPATAPRPGLHSGTNVSDVPVTVMSICPPGAGGGVLGGPIKFDSSCGCSDPSCNCSSLPGVAPAPTLSVAYVDKLLMEKPTPLFENFADVGNVLGGEDTLYSHDLDANELRFNGDSIQTEVTFLIAAGASATPRVYFAGIKIYDPGVVAAGVVEKAISLRVRITRATSATARATVTMTPDLSGTQYTPEGTLTGINFGAKITVLVTGAGTATNDIKAVQSSTTKTPSSTTLAGVLPMEILGRGPANAIAVPFSAADYSGAGASLLHTGSASGTSDVDVWVTPTATVTKGQLIRVFKEAGGVKQLVVAYELKARTADANNPDWQKAERAARVPITGVGEKIFVSKENNEGVIARSEPQNYFVG